MLYPFILTTPTADGNYKLNSGSGRAFAFDVVPGGIATIIIVHTKQEQQDFSLRCWISPEIGGSALILPPPNEPLWHALRIAHPIVAVYDESLPRPDIDFTLSVTPGSYFLNILNLTNAPNSFSFLLTN